MVDKKLKSRASKICFLARVARVRLVLLTTLLLSACVPAPPDPVRIATLPWPGYESLHLAQSLGYIDEQHLRTVELVNPGQIATALRNGTVTGGMITLDSALSLIQDGIELQVILVMDFSHGADAVLARPDITHLQQLRGKRVGVENGAVGGVMLDSALTEAGLTVEDIELLTMAVNEHTQAYREGKVDAVVTFEPIRSQLVQDGARVLFDSSRIPERIIDLLVVRKELVEHYKNSLTAIVAAHFRALDFMVQQPEQAHQKIAPFLGIPVTAVKGSFARLTLPSLEENYQLLGGKAPRLRDIAANLTAYMRERQLLLRPVNLEQILQPAFLPPVQLQAHSAVKEVRQ